MTKFDEETKVNSLLRELGDNRSKLHDMLDDISGFRKTLDDLLPKQVDYKSKWMIPERIKTVTEVIKSELAVRKQIDESVKVEIDIRRKEGDDKIHCIKKRRKSTAAGKGVFN